ncbi:MAG: 2-C-methyl-D-erythritol 2,4-cyclodiphosphate synthase [Dictyoglomus sp. NZ13-RE01]|nr:MAG: 2-C-methyl-D-erythritol 2,4-cyclodiphosphate synthase [Dictyoglomus sp. NZ13-RE01]
MHNKEKIYRVGIGYDIHPFCEGRKLFLGGIEIPFHKGLKGHSDGDVLIHSIMDALLGAMGLPDIGFFFPNTEPKYENIRSTELLKVIRQKIKEGNFYIENIDSMIIAEEPKIMPHRENIIRNLADLLEVPNSTINIKATTNEGLGVIGKGEGIAVFSIALLSKEKNNGE